jgi:hypothetical protein
MQSVVSQSHRNSTLRALQGKTQAAMAGAPHFSRFVGPMRGALEALEG